MQIVNTSRLCNGAYLPADLNSNTNGFELADMYAPFHIERYSLYA